jgi:3-oxoacyl-[acyl-carrier protein] reductase
VPLRRLKSRNRRPDLGEPTEIAEPAAFLCSEEARYITGATFDANGGLLMR